MRMDPIVVIGAGLAGSEAAWQIARHGVACELYEMRPAKMTPAHRTGRCAELVCSNSLGSALPDRATGLLQEEMKRCGSLLVEAALATRTPAGGALAVDREEFSRYVTERIAGHPLIDVRIREIEALPEKGPAVIATGPLTSDPLAADIVRKTGRDTLYFFDAMAPVIAADSIDGTVCFRASRYGRGDNEEGDYLNCPMERDDYERFVAELLAAEKAELRDFERNDPRFFEGCLPVEELARRGERTLAFGPLRPVGLTDPRTGRRPYAVVQLRRDNLAGTLYNMVGFQTNLKYAEQERVFRLVPGLERAEFVRLGQMHRNTFVNAPLVLDSSLEMKSGAGIFIAGQLAGVEGYMGNIASGWLAGTNAARRCLGWSPLTFPRETMTGALIGYLAHSEPGQFQPMKANFGILPGLASVPRGKRDRYAAMSSRALEALDRFLLATTGSL